MTERLSKRKLRDATRRLNRQYDQAFRENPQAADLAVNKFLGKGKGSRSGTLFKIEGDGADYYAERASDGYTDGQLNTTITKAVGQRAVLFGEVIQGPTNSIVFIDETTGFDKREMHEDSLTAVDKVGYLIAEMGKARRTDRTKAK